LALQGHPPRRFFQTFVLVSPISKSFYAQCGLFQWVDEAFAANLKTSASEDNLLNGDTVRVNQDTKKFGEKENTLVYKEYHHQNGNSKIDNNEQLYFC
jgi:hypothetical protein